MTDEEMTSAVMDVSLELWARINDPETPPSELSDLAGLHRRAMFLAGALHLREKSRA